MNGNLVSMEKNVIQTGVLCGCECVQLGSLYSMETMHVWTSDTEHRYSHAPTDY